MVIISTWGFPKGWRKVKYTYEGKDVSVESKSTLALLDEAFRNEKKVVMLPVTLADADSDESVDLKRLVLKRVMEGLKDDPKTLKVFEEAEKVIIPGRGKFLTNKRLKEFEAPTETIISSLILNLYERLEDRALLDITHGVNFYPVTLRGILERLMKIRALGSETELEVGASDPFKIPNEGNVTLTFRILERLKLSTKLSEMPNLVNEVGYLVKGEGLKEMQTKWLKLKKELLVYLEGLKAGSPLYWSYLLIRLYRNSELKELVLSLWDELLELVDRGYEVKDYKVINKVTINPNAVWALASYKSLYNFAKRFSNTEHFVLDKVFLVNFERLKELEKHLSPAEWAIWVEEKSKITKVFSKDFEAMIAEALNSISEIVSDPRRVRVEGKLEERLKGVTDDVIVKYLEELSEIIIKDKVIPYGIAKAYAEGRDLKESSLWWAVSIASLENHEDEAVRNFLAHGGAEQNVTLLRRSNDLKLIGYYVPVMNKLERGLRRKLRSK